MVLLHDPPGTPNTIWTIVHDDQFVTAIRDVLNKLDKVPGKHHVHDQSRAKGSYENHRLPLKIEYQLAQDLAFIAAHEEGVHAVSATTVA